MRKTLFALLLLTSSAWAQVGQIPLAVVPTPPQPAAFFIATNGSDGNPGTIGSPFATLGRCQTAMEGSSVKLCYVRGGTYSSLSATQTGCNSNTPPAFLVQLTHAKGDDGETFSYYPPDGIDSAVFNGGGTIPGAICAYHVKNVTVTGLSFTGFSHTALFTANWDANDGNGINNTFTGNVVAGGSPGISCAGWIEGVGITRNYVHDTTGQAIGCSTTQASTVGGLTGATIAQNVAYNACTAITDCGAIYLQDYQLPVSTGIKVTSNYIYQSNAAGSGAMLIYLDDGASNVTASGNVGIAGGTLLSCWLIHGGGNNVFTGNVCDEGSGSDILRYQQTTHTPGSFPMTGNAFTGNDIVCRNTASCGSGYVGLSPVAPAPEASHGNTYWNFQTGTGAVVSSGGGGANGDSGPIAANPNLLCFSGFSTAFGPPGFVLPATAPSWCGFFVATTGSDSNVGSPPAPFATLAKCQTAMRGSAIKTCILRAGTYTPASSGACAPTGADTAALNLGSPDVGETWSYWAADGVNSAVINGQNTAGLTNGLGYIVCSDGNAGVVTFNGLYFENVYKDFIYGFSALVVKNNVFNGQSFVNFPNNNGCLLFNTVGGGGPTVTHNVFLNCYDRGVDIEAIVNGGLNNTTVANNYFQNVCSHNGDCGALYLSNSTFTTPTGVTVADNFVRDINLTHNQPGVGDNVGFCFYQDGVAVGSLTMTGNVCAGNIGYANPAGGGGNACFFVNGSTGNTFTGNICSLSNTSMQIANFQNSSGSNIWSHNIIVANQAQNAGSGYAGTVANAISANQYFNYNTSFGVVTSGGGGSDSNPASGDPLIHCWGALLSPSSPAYGLPASFPAQPPNWDTPGFWGPPGFTMPQTGTPPLWPTTSGDGVTCPQ